MREGNSTLGLLFNAVNDLMFPMTDMVEALTRFFRPIHLHVLGYSILPPYLQS